MKRKPTLTPGGPAGPKGARMPGGMPKRNDKMVVDKVPTAVVPGPKRRTNPVATPWKPLLPPDYYNGR
jgi:hypothetical protein